MELAGGLIGGLFGGSGQKTSSKPVDTTPAEFKALRQPFADTISALLPKTSLIGTGYQGPFSAPMVQGEQTALDAVNNQAYNPFRSDLINRTLQGAYLPGQEGANPWLDQSVTAAINAASAPILRNMQRNLSATQGQFTAAGHLTNGANPNSPGGSSAFDVARNNLITDTNEQLGTVAANIAKPMYQQAYDQERERQQQAITIGQADVNTMISNLQASGLPRLIEDLGIQRAIPEFQSRVQGLIQALAIAAGVPMATQGTQSTGTSQSNGNVFSSLFPNGLGGGSK